MKDCVWIKIRLTEKANKAVIKQKFKRQLTSKEETINQLLEESDLQVYLS